MSRLNLSFSTLCLFAALSLWSRPAAAQEEPSEVRPSASFPDAAEADDTEAPPASDGAPAAAGSSASSPQAPGGSRSSVPLAHSPPTPPAEQEPAAQPAGESGTRFSELHKESGLGNEYRNFSDEELSREHAEQKKGGMVVLAVTGGSIVSIAGPLFLVGGVAAIACGSVGDPCPGIGAFVAITGGLSVVGGSMFVGGLVGSEKRHKRRLAIEKEMRRREEVGVTITHPRLGVVVVPGGGALTLSAHY